MSEAQLAERLARARDSYAREQLGTKDLAAVKARLDHLADLERGEEERRRASLSEHERLTADLVAAQSAADASRAELARVKFDSTILQACSRLGIVNTDYAMWVVGSQGSGDLNAGGVEALLRGQMELSASARAAFGVAAEARVVEVGMSTTTGLDGPDPGLGRPAPAKTSMDLSAAEWRAKRALYGL
jgi:hypothetical protein